MRTWVVAALVLALGWWLLSPDAPWTPQTWPDVASSDCPLPPVTEWGQAPLQTPLPTPGQGWRFKQAQLTAQAGFSVAARVLGVEHYRWDGGSDWSPLDLALGWQAMSEDGLLQQLRIRQSRRFYYYQARAQWPLPPQQIGQMSSNMHMIPANRYVARQLAKIKANQRVRIDGWLVDVRGDNGWSWRSSLRRDDTGAGACELVYVCAVTRLD